MDQLLLYGWYCLASCVRYFVVAGLIYGCFNVWFHARWAALRIQDAPPGEGQIAHEIRWSLSTIACGGLAGLVVYDLVQHGWTRMYFDLARHGWPYFALTVVLGIVAYDAWFYWKHRLLHTSWLFRRAHHVHHRVTNPTPFANFTTVTPSASMARRETTAAAAGGCSMSARPELASTHSVTGAALAAVRAA